MALSLEDVKRIAMLARLSVTEAEAEQALGELTECLRSSNK